MAVKLQGQFDIAVAEQSLDGLRIGSDADQERGQTVAKVVEPESAWIRGGVLSVQLTLPPAGFVIYQAPPGRQSLGARQAVVNQLQRTEALAL